MERGHSEEGAVQLNDDGMVSGGGVAGIGTATTVGEAILRIQATARIEKLWEVPSWR